MKFLENFIVPVFPRRLSVLLQKLLNGMMTSELNEFSLNFHFSSHDEIK